MDNIHITYICDADMYHVSCIMYACFFVRFAVCLVLNFFNVLVSQCNKIENEAEQLLNMEFAFYFSGFADFGLKFVLFGLENSLSIKPSSLRACLLGNCYTASLDACNRRTYWRDSYRTGAQGSCRNGWTKKLLKCYENW